MLTRNRMFSYYPPRLRFIEPPTPPEGTPGAPADGETPPGPPAVNEHGFPDATPVADMTPEHQAAYWKHHSRKHEGTANARSDYDVRKDESEKYRALIAASKTPEERAAEEARRQGEQAAAAPYLGIAVGALLEARTGKTSAEIQTVLELIDVSKFASADGAIDTAKVDAFAATIATKAPDAPEVPPTDPVKDQLERQQNDPAHRGKGSLKELTRQALESITPTTK